MMAAALAGCLSQNVGAQTFTTDEYQKALWMTTRFYGAQRSGEGPNWLIADHEPNGFDNDKWQVNMENFKKGKSFIKDQAEDGYDLTGGWFDCGDNVMFGQTEFYAAYMLLLGYSEFSSGYGDHYSADYKGYIGSSDYTWEGKQGIPNGVPDILDECKYATDFFMKCMRDDATFYWMVGDGDADHTLWMTSPLKSLLPASKGGEGDKPRPVEMTDYGATSMVALCGASLAAMSRLYRPYDAAYADMCLEKAKTAYQFIHNDDFYFNIGVKFYSAKDIWEPDCLLLDMELYRATGDSQYLADTEQWTDFMINNKTWNHGWTICYAKTEDLAYYMLGMYGGNELAKQRLADLINSNYIPTSGYVLNKRYDKWGPLRYIANQAFVCALNSKLNGEETVNPYTLATIEFILGRNKANLSFVVGFGDKSPKHPHHRNYYGFDHCDEEQCNNFDADIQFGYMVGGTINPLLYKDNEKDYGTSEGGIDYNAGLVGALGYLCSKLAPANKVDSYKSETCNLYPNPASDIMHIGLKHQGDAVVEVFDANGTLMMNLTSDSETLYEGLNVSKLPNGTYLIKVTIDGVIYTNKFVKI